MFVIPKFLGVSKSVGLTMAFLSAMALNTAASGDAAAQTARKLANKPITVRLCPASCIAVNGHSLKPGGSTTVLETRSGWARVSGFLDRKKLIPSFGDKITEKPALWVPVSALVPLQAEAKPAERKPVAKKKRVRRVNVVDQIARLRRPPTPSFRPGSSFVKATEVAAVEEQPKPVETTAPAKPVEPEAPKVEVIEAPKAEVVEAPQPKAPEAEAPKVEVVESRPIQSTPRGTEKTAALTWEEVQAKIEAQKARIAAGGSAEEPKVAEAPKIDTEAAKKAEAERLAQEAERKRADEARKAAEAKEAEEKRLAAQKEAERKAAEAKLAEEKRQREVAEQARIAREAEAKKQAEAKRLEEQKAAEAAAKAEEAKKLAEARRLEEQRAAEAAAKAAEAKKVAEAAEAKRKADEARIAAAKAAAAKKTDTDSVGYTPPKPADEAAPAKPETTEVAKLEEPKPAKPETPKVVLPPTVSKTVRGEEEAPKAAETTEAAKEEVVAAVKQPEAPEPTYTAAEADPIVFGERPKKVTRALLDKRLRKLPGPKSRVKKNIVIAMRHTALGLLNSGVCTGIAGGGASTTPGMFYLSCTDDPGYLRQFPIEEVSW